MVRRLPPFALALCVLGPCLPTQAFRPTPLRRLPLLAKAKAPPGSDLLANFPPESWSPGIDKFCRATNDFFKAVTLPPVRQLVETRPATDFADKEAYAKLVAPPELPGISRPVWLVILASVPTGLLWYGYYKFSVEEELYQDELARKGFVSGCGGYGTLFPFVYCFLLGTAASLTPLVNFTSLPSMLFNTGGLWILLSQVNLYRRVNELYVEDGEEEPLHAWWAILPPPLDVVVGLRQVHFLAKYWADIRGEKWEEDVVAESLFPFISSERFTLLEFARQPKRWFWFTKDWGSFW